MQVFFKKVFMTIGDRLRSARKELGLSQPEFAAIAGTTKQTLFSWETGKTAPDGFQLAALAAAGADVRYILTGARDGPAPERLSDDERAMLADYREASGAVRRAARAALQSGVAPSGINLRHVTQNATTPGAVQVIGTGNTVLSRTRK